MQRMIERHEFLRRLQPAARLRAQTVYPADHALVELLAQAHRVEDTRAVLEQAGQNLVDIGDREGVIGAVVFDRAIRARASAVPDLTLAITLAHEQDILGWRATRNQHCDRFGLVEAGQIIKIAVLPVVVLDITIAVAHRGRRQDRDGITTHLAHECAAAACEFGPVWSSHRDLGNRHYGQSQRPRPAGGLNAVSVAVPRAARARVRAHRTPFARRRARIRPAPPGPTHWPPRYRSYPRRRV